MSKRKNSGKEMTFWGHFIELSERLRVIIFAVVICTVVVAAVPVKIDFSNPLASQTLVTAILRQLVKDLLPAGTLLNPPNPLDPITVYMMISVILGVIVSLPIISYELYKFFNPALYPGERKFLYSFIISFVTLFTLGVVIAYKVIVPVTFWVLWLPIFTGGVTINIISILEFMTTVFWMCLATGLMFIIPIIFVLLVRQGIIGSDFLAKRRKFIYGGGFILAMILTPDPTPLTAAIICVPLFIILEIALVISKRYEKQRAAK